MQRASVFEGYDGFRNNISDIANGVLFLPFSISSHSMTPYFYPPRLSNSYPPLMTPATS